MCAARGATMMYYLVVRCSTLCDRLQNKVWFKWSLQNGLELLSEGIYA